MELFIKDKFSLKKPTWKRVTDDNSKKIILDIPSSLVTYLGKIKSINVPRATEVNSKNIMLQGEHNTLIIKKFDKKNRNVGSFFDMSNNELGIALEYIKGKYFNGAKNELEKTSISISKLMDGTRSIKLDSHNIDDIFPSNSSHLIDLFMESLPTLKQFTNTERSFIQKNSKILFL